MTHRRRVAIVGAGPQGLTAAVYLVAAGLDPDRLVVIDPLGDWLVAWDRRFRQLGIAHLRSPSVHHPHPDPYRLGRFAERHHRTAELVHRYGLPTTALFADFCRSVGDEHGLTGAVRRDRAVSIGADGLIELSGGDRIEAEHVVWATNPAEAVNVTGFVGSGSDAASSDTLRPGATIAVVGGGLTAGHLVERAIEAGAHVEWCTRRPLVEREFDTDPGWLGPKEMQAFDAIVDPADRVERVVHARGGGTVPPWMMRRLRDAERAGRVCCRVGTIEVSAGDDGRFDVTVDGSRVRADAVWTAVGDRPCTSAAPPLDRLCDELAVQRIEGRPVLDRSLRLPDSVVHVVGRLAQIRLGPTAGNLAGARHAAELVVGAVVGLHAMYALAQP